MTSRERPSTSAALPTDVSRSTLRDRLVERARVLAQKSPLVRVPRVPILVRNEVLYPEHHADVSAGDLYGVFHRADTLERAPLLIVVAPAAIDEDATLGDPPFIGTLARVRTDGDDEDGVRLQGLQRVSLDALPSSPRALVQGRPRPLVPGDEEELYDRIRDPLAAFLRGPMGAPEDQAQLIMKLPAVYLAYFVARVSQLPLRTQDSILRIDEAEELVNVATEMAEAGLVAKE